MTSITVLKTTNTGRLAKRFLLTAEGNITVSGYPNVTHYLWQTEEIGNIRQIHSFLVQLQRYKNACIIRGLPRSGLPQKAQRTNKNFPEPEEGTTWVMIDVDGAELPEGMDPCSREAAEFIVGKLPPEFRDVSYVVQLSNSAGIRNPDGSRFKNGIRVHIYFWLERPVPGKQLAAWLENFCYDTGFFRIALDKGNQPLVSPWIDMALLRSSVQPHYTAPPVIDDGILCDIQHPEDRVWMIEKSAGSVRLPEIDLSLMEQVVQRRRALRLEWARAHGFTVENRAVLLKTGLQQSERIVASNSQEVPVGRTLLGTQIRARGRVLGLVLADERTPGSWYVARSRPWLAKRMGDEMEVPLEDFCPAALEEVKHRGWVVDIFADSNMDTNDSEHVAAGAPVSTLSTPASGLVASERERFLNQFFLQTWGPDTFFYSNGYVQKMDGEPPNIKILTLFSFFYIFARIRNEHNSEWSYVLHVRCPDNSWNEVILPARDLQDRNTAAMELAAKGVEIYTPGKAQIAKYIQEYPCERIQLLIERTGWSRDGRRFVLPDRVFSRDPNDDLRDIYVTESAKQLIYGVRSKGLLSEWQSFVADLCFGSSRLEMALYMGFLPPLMKPLGHPTFGVHFWGTTSTGKSTAKQVAMSVWGDPTVASHQWRATDNGLEGLAYAHNDILMALDEIKQTTGHQVVADAVFLLGNEKGKVRADRDGGLRPIRQWRLAYLSTGEVATVQFLRDGGMTVMGGHAVRILDIPADGGAGMGIVESLSVHSTPRAHVEALDAATQQFHGTAAVAFLDALMASDRFDHLREDVDEFGHQFFQHLPGRERNSEMERILKHFAAIAFAGELAIAFRVLPYERGHATRTMLRIAIEYEEARGGSEGFDILERITWIRQEISRCRYSNFKRLNQMRNSFYDGGGGDPHKFWGYAIYTNSDSDQIVEFRIPRAVFKTIFCQNMDANRLVQALRERGYLSEDGHLIGKRRERCYILNYAFIAGGDEEIEVGEEEGRPRTDPLSDLMTD